MKLNFRVSVKKLLLAEMVVAALSFILALLFPGSYEMTVYLVAICLVHITVYSPIGFSQGFDFIMHDEPADSFLGVYHFISIFIATFVGSLLLRPLGELVDGIRTLLVG